MNPKKISSRLHDIIKSALVAAILPALFIYILVGKPDYRIMNSVAHIVLPVANFAGSVITWPIRFVGNTVKNINELANLRSENEELSVRLNQALAMQNKCEIALLDNQKLERELDVVKNSPYSSVIADIMFDNSAFSHNTYMISRGFNDGIERGMVVVSLDNVLVGIVIDSGANFSRVRSLTDSDINIAVRIAGSDVYGFLQGNGSRTPNLVFLSDPEFQVTSGIKLVTSSISGVLPPDIYVGETRDKTDINILSPDKLSRVVVLKYNNQGKYK